MSSGVWSGEWALSKLGSQREEVGFSMVFIMLTTAELASSVVQDISP